MTDAPSTATLVLTRGWLPGVRTAQVVVDGGPPQRLRAGQVLTLPVGRGPHEVRVLAGGARSHLHRVELAEADLQELEVGIGWTDDPSGTPSVPALLGAQGQPVPVVRPDGVPSDDSWWPFWAVVLGLTLPPVGAVVAALALRRPGLSSVSRGLAIVGLVLGVAQVLVFLGGAVWVVTADA